MEASDLAEELWFEILSRLPVQSIIRFKSVCKLWYSIIISSAFTSQHNLYHQNSKDHNIIVFDYSSYGQQPVISLFRASDDFQVCHLLPIPLFKQNYSFISCNGLVFAHKTVYSLGTCDDYVWNPATNQFRSLPQSPPSPPLSLNHPLYNISWGFGFDYKTNNYKIIKIYQSRSENHFENLSHAIYSFSTNSWSTTTASCSIPFIFNNSRAPCYNYGVYFWLGSFSNPHSTNVISFDFSSEEFRLVSVPIIIQRGQLSPLRGKLAFYGYTSFEEGNKLCYEIWTLNDYGVDDTWTKLFKIRVCHSQIMIRGGFLNNTEFLLVGNNEEKRDGTYNLSLLDPITQEIATTLPLQRRLDIVTRFEYVIYKESLVSV